jgi:chitodextrinase
VEPAQYRTKTRVALVTLALVSVVGLDRAAAPTNGLIGYWRFDETSGTTALDSSTGGHPGTLSNGPTWTPGKVGNAVLFDASDNGNDADDPRVVLGTGFDVVLPFTISAWVRPQSYADHRAIFSKRDSYSSANMRFQWTLDSGSGRVEVGRSGSTRTFNYGPPLNTWTHLAVVLTSSSVDLYVNGQLEQSRTGITLGTDATANTVIGNTGESQPGGDGDPFEGAIDELRVYNRALTTQEVTSLFTDQPAVPDTQAPSVPGGLSATAASSSQINLSWSASTDNVGVVGYRVERCQGSSCTTFTQVATPAGTTYSDSGLSPSTTYRYRVRAADAAGNLSGYSSIASATTQAGSTGGATYGLEWPGDGSVRRMLYWSNPFPIYDATYIFKVYPRKKTTGTYKYYTTFFWGNNGNYAWDGGVANTYYGAHPYPVPAPSGAGQWEISVQSHDITTGVEVSWNRWHTQAFRARRVSPSQTEHEFYYDLPDTSKVIRYTVNNSGWADRNPPSPAIVMGQAPNFNGLSWGGYPGWEEFNGIIRGIQLYTTYLSVTDITNEIATPKSTAAGASSIWYLNLDPRPSDVTDKKASGTAHNPQWDGTTALEWTSGGGSSDTTAPSVPGGLSATALSSLRIDLSWSASSDNVAVAGYRVYRGGVLVSTVTTTSYSDTGLAANTTYSYTVQAYDAAGNQSAQSSAASATTLPVSDTTPPVISSVGASGISPAGATISWTTNEPADAQVQYGTTTSYGSQTALNASLVSSHSQVLSGLAASTTYHYRVLSRDAAGNLAASGDFSFTTANASSSGDITTGLTAYWKLDEGSGTQAGDSAGSNTGTLVNGAAWTVGRVRQALQFNATDNGNDADDPRVTAGTAFDVTLPFTIAAWVKPQGYTDYRAIFSKRDGFTAANMRFDFELNRSTGYVYVGQAGSSRIFSYAPPTNTWTHLTVVLTSSATTLYVNGTAVQSLGPITLGTDTVAKVALGNTGDAAGGDGDPFLGAIDEVRIYNRALSAGDVQTLFSYQ